MDFQLSEEHRAVADLAATIMRAAADPARQQRLEREGDWMDRDLWRSLADAGLLGICLPEDVGGAGLDLLAQHLLLKEAGATAAHVPLLETLALGATVIDRHGTAAQRQAWLPGVAAGDVILTAALVDEEPATVEAPAARLEPTGDGWTLTGVKTLVPVARLATRLLVSAATPDGATALVVVDPSSSGVALQPQETPSDVPHDRVTLDGVAVDNADLIGGAPGPAPLQTLRDIGRSAIASAQAGLAFEAVTLAAKHTSERQQFGRAIATFQAVSQRVADARIAAGMLDLVALQAAWRLADGLPCRDELAIAKWWVGEAGHAVVHAVHHVHGGIGVDKEYPLHRLFGRAKQHEFALGSSVEQLVELGRSMAAQPA